MTSVPSSNIITVMLANYLTNNDPDKWLDMMNEKSKELSMTNTKWFNASGAAAVAFKGYYSPQRYDNNQSNQTTARDLVIMTYNFIKKYPDILKYTSKPVVAVKEGTPYEETFETYNYSIPGANYGLKGVDGSKTGSIIMGSGDWSDQTVEEIRHTFGNALVKKMYKDFSYKKVLSKGEQEIAGKKYNVENDIYATVKKGQEPKISAKDDQIVIDNGLKTVSPNIKPTSVKDTKAGFFLYSFDQKNKQTSNHKTSMKNFALFCFLLLPIYVIYLIFNNEKKRHQKFNERRQAR